MTLPAQVQNVLQKMYDKFGHMNHQGDDMRRKWTRMVAEQLVYTFGRGSGWGHKASTPTNPPSKDAIAQQQKDGKLFGWDVIAGGSLELIKEGIFHDITGQYFIEVEAVDHLAQGEPSQPPAPLPQPPVECKCADAIRELAGRIDALTLRLSVMSERMGELKSAVEEPRLVTGKVNARFLSGGTIEGEVSKYVNGPTAR